MNELGIDTALRKEDEEAPGQHEEDNTDEIVDNLRKGRNHRAQWRKDARENYDFYASEQWSTDDKAVLEEQGRPAVVFNRLPRIINAISGLEVQNRHEPRYLPREIPADAIKSEMLNGAAKWARQQCDAEDEESDAFQDLLITGEGWTEDRMDYERDSQGMIVKDRIDPLEILVDPTAKKRNYADAKWVAHVKELTKREVKDLGYDVNDLTPNTFWNDSDGDEPHDATSAHEYHNDQSDKLSRSSTYAVIKYQYYTKEKYYAVVDERGEIQEFPLDRFEKIKPMLDAQGMQYAELTKRVYKQAFICGKKKLEEIDLGCNHFTLQSMTGLRNRNKNTYFGLAALMKDPQRWANKWLSQIQHIINSNAKGGLIAEQNTFVNPQQAQEEWSKQDSITYVLEGALQKGKLQQKEAPRYPDGIDRLMQQAIQAISDVPGVNDEFIGLANRDQPMGLEEIRRSAVVATLSIFFDSLRKYRKETGRILAYFIREYISDGRLIRIVGEQGAQVLPLMKDKLMFDYDIVVEEAPSSPQVKDKVFNVLSQLLPMILQAGIPVPPDILDYAPFPEALTQKWKAMIGQKDPIAEEMKHINMMLATLETEEKKAGIEEIQSKTQLNYAKAGEAQATGQDESMQAMQKAGLATREHEMKEEQMLRDDKRENVKMMLAHRRDVLKAQLDAKVKAQQSSQRSA
jgi:hypothetical protein